MVTNFARFDYSKAAKPSHLALTTVMKDFRLLERESMDSEMILEDYVDCSGQPRVIVACREDHKPKEGESTL